MKSLIGRYCIGIYIAKNNWQTIEKTKVNKAMPADENCEAMMKDYVTNDPKI